MSEFWSNTVDEGNPQTGNHAGQPYIFVNGQKMNVEVGMPFASTVKEMAGQAGLGKFKVYMNGEEVKRSTAPENFEENMYAEIRPFDQAG